MFAQLTSSQLRDPYLRQAPRPDNISLAGKRAGVAEIGDRFTNDGDWPGTGPRWLGGAHLESAFLHLETAAAATSVQLQSLTRGEVEFFCPRD